MKPLRIRAVIIDDEPLAREGIRIRLGNHADVEVVGESGNVGDALAFLERNAVDLLFLDIEMPGAIGFELLDRIPPASVPAVVFVTAYAEHAVDAFRVRAVDYLLKPIEDERFVQAMENVRVHFRSFRQQELKRPLLLSNARGPEPSPRETTNHGLSPVRIAVRMGGRIRFVAVRDIDWVGADGDYVRLHVGADSFLVRSTMSDFLAQLDPRRFARIHRSTIVQVDRIREMQPLFHGEFLVLLKDGTKLKLTRSYRSTIETLLGFL